MSKLLMEIVKQLRQAKDNLSTKSLFVFMVGVPIRRLRRKSNREKIQKLTSLNDRFSLIYSLNVWGSKESVSGSGSTLAMTESIRALLPSVIEKFGVKTIFDAPCGDFNWMKLINLQNLKYLGGDIVEPLINDLQEKYTSKSISFVQIDITKTIFPKSDLVLNRDCLFHLSYRDILLTLSNFLTSESKYFLSTSHDNYGRFRNKDISSGDFRLIDLFAEPFNFPINFHFEIPEPGEGSLPSRKLYLWDREQVRVAHSSLNRFLSNV